MIKYTIELLNEMSVSISRIELNEEGKQVGETHKRTYLNNEKEIQELHEDVPTHIYNAVMIVWDEANTK